MLGWRESEAGIKIPRRNINNLRYADDIILMAESEEELKNLLMRVTEENENSTSKKLRSWHLVPPLHDKYKRKIGSDRFYFLGLQNHCG